MSTDPDALGRRLAARTRPTVVVSTYQSSAAACASAAAAGCAFALTVFDECHRVCGGREPRPANYVLLQVPPAATGPRLFMTATPVTRGGGITMAEHALFGGVAYRYHLRQGIDAGFVNDFEIQLVAAGEDADIDSRRAAGAPPTVLGRCRDAFLGLLRLFVAPAVVPSAAPGASPPGAVDGATRVLAAQVVLAFDHLRSVPGRNKLLVFCRTIAATRRLAEAIRFLFQQRPDGLGAGGPGAGCGDEGDGAGAPASRVGPTAPLVLHASSKTPREELAAALRTFYDPARPVILLNCKLFQEGVEFPPLNGVFFATPRHSSRDIVQSMCRALTRAPGKPRSAVYIPVPAAAPPAGGGPPAPLTALGRFETLLPFAEAIYSEDPRFYEHLLDPATPFPLGWLGVHGDGEQLLHAARRAIRYGTRGGARAVDRLTRSDAIPWGVAFGELRRIVHECRRYPKGNDGFAFALARELPEAFGAPGAPKVLNFGTWYDWARREYGRYRAGEASALQPHQARDLESLPEWETRGMEGPYPTRECVETLERLLEESGGVMPPVNINNGGWIGLDATPLERLSGFLTTVSQQDGRARAAGGANRGFTLSADKAALLDAAFGKWGLVWRKQRWYPEAELDAVVAEGKAADRAAAAAWLTAAGRPGFLVTGTTKSGKPGDYAGPRTVIQEAHEQFNALARADPRDPFIQKHWPGYPLKHKRMEHDDVWEKGLAPPRHLRGKLISRAPAAAKKSAA